MESPKPSRTIKYGLRIDSSIGKKKVAHTSALPDNSGVRSDRDGISCLGDVSGDNHDLRVITFYSCSEVFVARNCGSFTPIATSGSVVFAFNALPPAWVYQEYLPAI
jgi:hypothetical protein